jgi:hypothetical protein
LNCSYFRELDFRATVVTGPTIDMKARAITICGAAAVLGALASPALSLPAASSLTSFVVRTGEETGFKPEAPPAVYSSIAAFVHGEHDTAQEARKDSARLAAEGFHGAAIEYTILTHSSAAGAGLSSVVELGSPAAAARELAHDVLSDIAAQGKRARIRRFTVSGVPGAVGFTATEARHPGGAANVSFSEGNCVLLVGDSLSKGDLAGPVKAGTLAIYRRTNGDCP